MARRIHYGITGRGRKTIPGNTRVKLKCRTTQLRKGRAPCGRCEDGWLPALLGDNVGMKQRGDSVQYTVRGIPREIDRALRQKAAQRKQSLNRVILDELAAAT